MSSGRAWAAASAAASVFAWSFRSARYHAPDVEDGGDAADEDDEEENGQTLA